MAGLMRATQTDAPRFSCTKVTVGLRLQSERGARAAQGARVFSRSLRSLGRCRLFVQHDLNLLVVPQIGGLPRARARVSRGASKKQ